MTLTRLSIQAGKGMLEEASTHYNSPTREEKLHPATPPRTDRNVSWTVTTVGFQDSSHGRFSRSLLLVRGPQQLSKISK